MANNFSNVEVTVTKSVTINIGDFQNIKPEYSLSVTLDEGANPNEVRAKLLATIDSWLEADIKEAKSR